ncbi:MAG: hypothetical protein HC883_00910 [Bdellovibrionaceae bacterium]|nr:hypothetical protein [Pseudobdellovibrionaceae bacterium]
MGYGSALMMLKLRYGSPAALSITEKVASFIMNEAYKASALLAKEKGAFPAFNSRKYLAGKFVQNLDMDTKNLIAKYGIRNSHLLSIQPTGNSSVLANNVSGGLEPLFMTNYVRTVTQPFPPDGLGVPADIDWGEKTYRVKGPPTSWKWMTEGGENILVTQFNGVTWKFDQSRGLLRESKVKDYAFRFHEKCGTWNPKADWAATAFDLSIGDHVRTMEVLSKYVDSAMSKTVNIPGNYPYEDFKRLYMDVYKTKTIKGCTSYREGTMTSVLSVTGSSIPSAEDGIPRSEALPRPKSLSCTIHHITSSGSKWVVLVGLLGNDPYEVFALKQSSLHLPPDLKNGKLVKEKSGLYNLETKDGWVLRDIRKFFESDEQEALTRMISTALRHGANIDFIVSQLIKSEGTITSFAKAIARTLKTYAREIAGIACSSCKSPNVKLQEGCYMCLDCGSSKCE